MSTLAVDIITNAAGTGGPSFTNGVVDPVVSKTGNYTLVASDKYVSGSASGGAFTLTLPTAVGIAGREYIIMRTDDTPANALGVATTSSQTIGSFSSPFNLYSKGELLGVISDGANWQISRRFASTVWIDESANFTWTSLGTVSASNVWCRRNGDSLEVRANVTSGTPTAVALKLNFPARFTLDSTKFNATAGINRVGIADRVENTVVPESGAVFYDGSDTAAVYFDITLACSGSAYSKQNGNALVASGDKIACLLTVPISGWKA